MAESLAIINLIGTIVQFVDFSAKVIERLDEFKRDVSEVPKSFRDLHNLLPLLQETLKGTKNDAESKLLDETSAQAVLAVVKGCQAQCQLLNEILQKILPAQGDSKLRRSFKVFSSVRQEKAVKEILYRIQQYQISLIHYHTTSPLQVLPMRTKSLFFVPFPRDPHFVGREDCIEAIDNHFLNYRRAALAGLGGVGKSQIAIEYCHRFKQGHQQASVLWVHASTVARFHAGYKGIARNARIPGWDDPKTDTMTLVKEWLCGEEIGEWLLVLDNADDSNVFFNSPHDPPPEEPVAEFIPHNEKGFILLTTRDRRVGERLADKSKAIIVESFSPKDARTLLQQSMDLQRENEHDIVELLDVLSYLPLAITQAASFITENEITVAKYLSFLKEGNDSVKELLSREIPDIRRDPKSSNSAIMTWKVSFEHIQKSDRLAAEILSLIAFLDRQSIPEGLLQQSESPVDFAAAIGTLRAFSLLFVESGGTTYEVHRLVHLATQKWLDVQGTAKVWRERALKVVSEEYPFGEFENWAVCDSLTPHMQTVLGYMRDSANCELYAAKLLNSVQAYDWSQGRYQSALEKNQTAFYLRQNQLGPEDPDTLVSANNLATTYSALGRYQEAAVLAADVLDKEKKVLGPEHPDTLASMSNLANYYSHLGRYQEAAVLAADVLDKEKKVRGPEHPDTLRSMNNLAKYYGDLGRYQEAAVLAADALDKRKRIQGPEHPDTLACMHNLANYYGHLGRYQEAAVLAADALDKRKRILGPEHPDTLRSMHNLAAYYGDLGRYQEAQELGLEVLDLSSRILGPEEDLTLGSMSNLAGIYRELGGTTEAEQLQRKVLEIRKRKRGPEHPNTLIAMENLALTIGIQGQREQAMELMESAVELSKKVLGNEHPDTRRRIQWLEERKQET